MSSSPPTIARRISRLVVRCDLSAHPLQPHGFLRRMPHVPPWFPVHHICMPIFNTACEAAPAIQRHP